MLIIEESGARTKTFVAGSIAMIGLIAEPPFPIFGKLNFSTIRIIRPHNEQVVIFCKSDIGAVGRVGCPILTFFFIKGIAFDKIITIYIVGKLNTVNMKGKSLFVGIVLKIFQVKIQGIERPLKDLCELCSHFFLIKKEPLIRAFGIYEIPIFTGIILVGVPKVVGVFYPFGIYRSITNQLFHFITGKPFGGFKIGLLCNGMEAAGYE